MARLARSNPKRLAKPPLSDNIFEETKARPNTPEEPHDECEDSTSRIIVQAPID